MLARELSVRRIDCDNHNVVKATAAVSCAPPVRSDVAPTFPNVEGKHMDLTSLLIQLASGALGGNLAGSVLKSLSLGLLGNSLAGLVGGGLGGQIIGGLLGISTGVPGALDIGSIIGQVASGGVGGGIVMAIVGLLRNMLAK